MSFYNFLEVQRLGEVMMFACTVLWQSLTGSIVEEFVWLFIASKVVVVVEVECGGEVMGGTGDGVSEVGEPGATRLRRKKPKTN